jgi:hypothetical protein
MKNDTSILQKDLLDDPDHWTKRAEDIRDIAKATEDKMAKATLRRIAVDYDRRASRRTKRAKTIFNQ